MVAGAGELVAATGAVVLEAAKPSGGQVVDPEAVAARGLGPEVPHDTLPLLPVGPDAPAEEGVGDEMGAFMGDGLSKKRFRIAG
jgi:hypothetical protein